MPGLDRLIVFLAGRGALLQLALDDPAGDLELEARHGGAVGQREDVGRLQRLVEHVDERLADRHLGEQAVDAGVDVERLQRQAAARRRREVGRRDVRCDVRCNVSCRRGNVRREMREESFNESP